MLPSQDNLKRLIQSFARSDGKDDVSMNHLNQARRLLVANFEGLLNNPGSSVQEVFESVRVRSTGRFRDIYDLQDILSQKIL